MTLANWRLTRSRSDDGFGITTVYHFVLVPATIGLSLVCHPFCRPHGSRRNRSLGDPVFGKLLLINFALGVARSIVRSSSSA